jgi:hypothetical protein
MFLKKQKKRKPSIEDVYSFAEELASKSIYYITFHNLMSEFNLSYSTVTKMMLQYTKDYQFLREGTSNEAHFVHPDYHQQYLTVSKKQLEDEKHHTKHVKKLADIRGWVQPALIDKLQLRLVFSSPSLANTIYKRFENTEYKKYSSVVIGLDEGVDKYTFVIYPKSMNIYVEFFNGMEIDYEKLNIFFDILRRKVLNLYGKVAFTLHIPLSFLFTQIYVLHRSFDTKAPYIQPFTKNISLTLSELVPYLSDK